MLDRKISADQHKEKPDLLISLPARDNFEILRVQNELLRFWTLKECHFPRPGSEISKSGFSLC